MILSLDGWQKYSIWDHSAQLCALYEKRCNQLAEEMICHKQTALLLRPLISDGDTLLDVGCGSGYFFHSLRKHDISVDYYGIDASQSLLDIGRRCMGVHGLPPARLFHGRIEDLDGSVDHIVCINVLSNIDNYHRPLERMLKMAKKSIILRESLATSAHYSYVKDEFLDENVNLNVHVNTYDQNEILEYIRHYKFKAQLIIDEYTNGKPQNVIGYEHHWCFVLAEKLE